MKNEAFYMTGLNQMEKREVAMPTAQAGGKIVAEDMISKCFDFEESKEAFDYAINNRSEVVKVLIKVKATP
jgi:threonine dehydrogenase-like Zn-dependent dehydrogenase